MTRVKTGSRRQKRLAAKAKARPAFAHKPKCAPAPARGQWFSVNEAAEVLGVSATTIRKRANGGEWPTRNNGRLEVWVSEQ